MEQKIWNMEGIQREIPEIKKQVYTIGVSQVQNLEKYPKTLYLRMLCSVALFKNNPTEMQTLLLQRFIAGLQQEETLINLMHQAGQINIANVRDFVDITKRNNIKYYFALDSILLTSLGEKNRDNLEYVAELINIIKVQKADLACICEIARSFLLQDISIYNRANENITKHLRNVDFEPYLTSFSV